ncbi:hypothetical protein [Maribacter sp. 2308TA10-17]|uniref:hypothetical protein n=1 Tax=Maribacter sp. 2308TA10-17 TaxID=3386276 RepID=UPI0039BD2136
MSVKKKKSRFRKILKGIFAFVGVGGILAIINFYIEYNDKKDSKYQRQLKEWQVQLKEWEKWYPEPISAGNVTLYTNGLDLDTGQRHSNFNKTNIDLMFSGGDVGFNSYLRALNKMSWLNKGLVDQSNITYQELKNARYARKKHAKSNYYDLFHEHPSNSPLPGYVYFLKTSKGNFAILKISSYTVKSIPGPGHHFFRKLNLHYTTFPNKQFPPRPIKPKKS